MIELPDVNVLVALLDPAHIHHHIADNWFAQAEPTGWATCPLTESGMIRVLTNSGYDNHTIKPFGAWRLLRDFLTDHAATHHFFSDDVQITDAARYNFRHLQGYKQITDLHLMGLCQQKGVRFVTLDNALQSSWFALVNRQLDLIRFLLPPTAPAP